MSARRPWRWLLGLVRYGLCAAAVAYLLGFVVHWHDRVRLVDAGEEWFRVLEHRPDGLVIERDGRPRLVPLDQVRHVSVRQAQVPDLELGIRSVVLRMDRLKALWAVLIFLPVVILQSLRLVLMLGIQDVWLSFWNAVKLTFAGNFFNFALPGTTGGDLVKAYYVAQYTHRKTEVVTTIFLDRAIGLLGLVLLAGSAMLLTWDREQFGQLITVLVLICAGLAAGAVLIFSRRLRHALRLPELAGRLPFGEQLLRIGRATVAMRQHKLLVLASLVLTLLLQAIVMVSAGVMAWALDMTGGLAYYFIYVSIGFLIAAIPISPPQAFGIMEYFYVLFFAQGRLANDPSQAVALALAVRLIQLVWALPGLLVPLLGAHVPRKAELAALEHATDAAPGASARP